MCPGFPLHVYVQMGRHALDMRLDMRHATCAKLSSTTQVCPKAANVRLLKRKKLHVCFAAWQSTGADPILPA